MSLEDDRPRDRAAAARLPRVVGVDPESGDEITAQNGQYGPYLKKGADTRSLPSEDQIFDIDLAGALELYAQPKYGARGASSALKEFEADPVSGKPIKVKDGRFGPTSPTAPRTRRSRAARRSTTSPSSARSSCCDQARQGPCAQEDGPAKKRPRPPPRTAAKKPAAAKKTGVHVDRPVGGRRAAACSHQGRRLRRRGSDEGVKAGWDRVFITLEGGDGSGKSTQAESARRLAGSDGRTVVRTREPGRRRGRCRDPRDRAAPPRATSPRAPRRCSTQRTVPHHIETAVRPALARGEVVIQDRYIDSSVAYQGAGRVLGADEVRELSLWATGGLLPDLTVLLDLDETVARGRLDAAQKPFDRLEAEKGAFHARVRRRSSAWPPRSPERFLVVDAALPVQEIAARHPLRVATLLGCAGRPVGRAARRASSLRSAADGTLEA